MRPRLVCVLGSFVWVGVVQLFKLKRKKHLKKITNKQALAFKVDSEDFPFLVTKALEFALYRTYAIPSISALLQKTKEFEAQVAKRYDDTVLLLQEGLVAPFGSERSDLAWARINQVHAMYKSITNEEMLYVLSVFPVQTVRWVNKYGWRKFTDQELEAHTWTYTMMGHKMGIKDVPQTYKEFEKLHDSYEAMHMRHAPSNEVIGEATTQLLLSAFPRFTHHLARKALVALMDEPLREAMGLPQVSFITRWAVHAAMKARAVLISLFVPPLGRYQWRSPKPDNVNEEGVRKYMRFQYEDTYPDGYHVPSLGPPHCPVLPNDQLLSRFSAQDTPISAQLKACSQLLRDGKQQLKSRAPACKHS